MSQIAKKHLLAGIIFGDAETGEYIYLPGGEVGTDLRSASLNTTDRKKTSISTRPATSSTT